MTPERGRHDPGSAAESTVCDLGGLAVGPKNA